MFLRPKSSKLLKVEEKKKCFNAVTNCWVIFLFNFGHVTSCVWLQIPGERQHLPKRELPRLPSAEIPRKTPRVEPQILKETAQQNTQAEICSYPQWDGINWISENIKWSLERCWEQQLWKIFPTAFRDNFSSPALFLLTPHFQGSCFGNL